MIKKMCVLPKLLWRQSRLSQTTKLPHHQDGPDYQGPDRPGSRRDAHKIRIKKQKKLSFDDRTDRQAHSAWVSIAQMFNENTKVNYI